MTVVLLLALMSPAVFADDRVTVVPIGEYVLDNFYEEIDADKLSVLSFGPYDFAFPGEDFWIQIAFEGKQFVLSLDDFLIAQNSDNFVFFAGDASIGGPAFSSLETPSSDLPFILMFQYLFGSSELVLLFSPGNNYPIGSSVEFGLDILGSPPAPAPADVVSPLVSAITGIITWEAVVSVLVGILGVAVVLIFSWWAARKGVRLLMAAFRRGKIRI